MTVMIASQRLEMKRRMSSSTLAGSASDGITSIHPSLALPANKLLSNAPIDAFLVRHRFIHERIEPGVIRLQRLARRNRPIGAERRKAGAGGVEVRLDAGAPVLDALAIRRRAAPQLRRARGLVQFRELIVEL